MPKWLQRSPPVLFRSSADCGTNEIRGVVRTGSAPRKFPIRPEDKVALVSAAYLLSSRRISVHRFQGAGCIAGSAGLQSAHRGSHPAGLGVSMRQLEGDLVDGLQCAKNFGALRPPISSPNEGSSARSQDATRRGCKSVSDHLFLRGFLEGVFSDVIVSAFGRDWMLHRIVLSRLPFFNSMFEGGWKESSGDRRVELNFDDPAITSSAFEAVLDLLYGGRGGRIDDSNVFNLMATASYFDMRDLMESCVDYIQVNLGPSNLNRYLNFAVSRSFGHFSARIQEACYTALCRDGKDRLRSCLCLLPGSWLRQVLSSEALCIESEFERYKLIAEVMERRAVNAGTQVRAKESGDTDRKLRKTLSSMTLIDVPPSGNYDSDRRLSTLSASLSECPPRDINEKTGGSPNSPGIHEHADTFAECPDELYSGDRDVFDYLLNCGVFYTHMTFAEVRSVFADGLVRRKVLERGWWHQAELRACISATGADEKALVRRTAEHDGGNDSKGGFHSRRRNRLFAIPSEDKTYFVDSAEMARSSSPSETEYSVYEPFRFSVEFTNIQGMQPPMRQYSESFFYAGSTWNLYIQKGFSTARKRPQIGVYLNRHGRGDAMAKDAPPGDAMSYYADPRNSTKTWFKIYCASHGPSYVITAFQSKADFFAVDQSWGWKSVALCSDDYLVGNFDDCKDGVGSLRFSVVLGHV